jgi:hypothetical protein
MLLLQQKNNQLAGLQATKKALSGAFLLAIKKSAHPDRSIQEWRGLSNIV